MSLREVSIDVQSQRTITQGDVHLSHWQRKLHCWRAFRSCSRTLILFSICPALFVVHGLVAGLAVALATAVVALMTIVDRIIGVFGFIAHCCSDHWWRCLLFLSLSFTLLIIVVRRSETLENQPTDAEHGELTPSMQLHR